MGEDQSFDLLINYTFSTSRSQTRCRWSIVIISCQNLKKFFTILYSIFAFASIHGSLCPSVDDPLQSLALIFIGHRWRIGLECLSVCFASKVRTCSISILFVVLTKTREFIYF